MCTLHTDQLQEYTLEKKVCALFIQINYKNTLWRRRYVHSSYRSTTLEKKVCALFIQINYKNIPWRRRYVHSSYRSTTRIYPGEEGMCTLHTDQLQEYTLEKKVCALFIQINYMNIPWRRRYVHSSYRSTTRIHSGEEGMCTLHTDQLQEYTLEKKVCALFIQINYKNIPWRRRYVHSSYRSTTRIYSGEEGMCTLHTDQLQEYTLEKKVCALFIQINYKNTLWRRRYVHSSYRSTTRIYSGEEGMCTLHTDQLQEYTLEKKVCALFIQINYKNIPWRRRYVHSSYRSTTRIHSGEEGMCTLHTDQLQEYTLEKKVCALFIQINYKNILWRRRYVHSSYRSTTRIYPGEEGMCTLHTDQLQEYTLEKKVCALFIQINYKNTLWRRRYVHSSYRSTTRIYPGEEGMCTLHTDQLQEYTLEKKVCALFIQINYKNILWRRRYVHSSYRLTTRIHSGEEGMCTLHTDQLQEYTLEKKVCALFIQINYKNILWRRRYVHSSYRSTTRIYSGEEGMCTLHTDQLQEYTLEKKVCALFIQINYKNIPWRRRYVHSSYRSTTRIYPGEEGMCTLHTDQLQEYTLEKKVCALFIQINYKNTLWRRRYVHSSYRSTTRIYKNILWRRRYVHSS